VHGRATLAVRTSAIEGAGDDARGRRLADAADTCKHPGMWQATRVDSIRQGTHHRFLTDQLFERDRAVFACEHPVSGRRFGCRFVEGEKLGQI
jgi:hypothetical protein